MPMLRTEFPASGKEIKSARLYVTARGIYEIYINGNRVGEDYFNPGLTQYNVTNMYQTYDITSMIIPGSKNAIGAWLGEGWWSGNITFSGSSAGITGTKNNFNFDKMSLTGQIGENTGIVKESGKPVKRSKAVTFVKLESGKAVYELKPGIYRFITQL